MGVENGRVYIKRQLLSEVSFHGGNLKKRGFLRDDDGAISFLAFLLFFISFGRSFLGGKTRRVRH